MILNDIKDLKRMLLVAAANMFIYVSILVGVIEYTQFINSQVYTDLKISVVNNPVTDVIEFRLSGNKPYQCDAKSTVVEAYNTVTNEIIHITKFKEMYIHNTRPGELVTNEWSMYVPESLKPGRYSIKTVGFFNCQHRIWAKEKIQLYDKIELIVE